MSTLGNGSTTSSILPCSRVILSDMPLTATISLALSMMVDMSTPITCFAPALTANLCLVCQSWSCDRKSRWGSEERIHAENSGTASDIEDDLVLEKVGILVDRVSVALGSYFILLLRLLVCVRYFKALACGPIPVCTHQHFLVDAFTCALVGFSTCQTIERTVVVVAVRCISNNGLLTIVPVSTDLLK